MERILARLEQAHGEGADVPAYLSSHPATEERVRALRESR
jgi:predicted Zn-dependent protease